LVAVLKNRFQQVVVVIGIGLGLWLLGNYITSLGQPFASGWTGYAPLSKTPILPGQDFTPGEQLLIWLGLIALWVVASAFILKDRTPGSD
jgi:heme/copper-type cytochrome/quinol oxidase subunit 1